MADQTTAEKAQATAQKAIYAAIGAPARATKVMGEAISDRIADATARMTERRSKAIKEFRAEFDSWAEEGENLVNRFQDRTMVDDIASRANVDQFQEQVGKLRHQLEDMLETWRANFLPERADVVKTAEKVEIVADKVEVKKPAAKPAAKATAKKAPAKKAPAKKTASAAKKAPAKSTAKKAPAKSTTAKSTAAKASAAKKAPAKKAPASKPAAKATAKKAPAKKTATAAKK